MCCDDDYNDGDDLHHYYLPLTVVCAEPCFKQKLRIDQTQSSLSLGLTGLVVICPLPVEDGRGW